MQTSRRNQLPSVKNVRPNPILQKMISAKSFNRRKSSSGSMQLSVSKMMRRDGMRRRLQLGNASQRIAPRKRRRANSRQQKSTVIRSRSNLGNRDPAMRRGTRSL